MLVSGLFISLCFICSSQANDAGKGYINSFLQVIQGVMDSGDSKTILDSIKYKFGSQGQKETLISDCCRIGHFAGEKGFLCQADYYKPWTRHRNQNRPHPRGKLLESDLHLLKEFELCSGSKTASISFNKCCFKTTRQVFDEDVLGFKETGDSMEAANYEEKADYVTVHGIRLLRKDSLGRSKFFTNF